MKSQHYLNITPPISPEVWAVKVVNSSLWAACGDALGWMTELSHGQLGVKRRTGVSIVSEPLPWERLIGGRNGPKVSLPTGTYSDDTQLRLASSRSIRGNGFFDVESFAKVELTVWPTYALGAGLGSKAAALSLSRRGVNWFSNFFESGSQSYVAGGGNGAAMRIQPHVWSSVGPINDVISNVLRDALVTHGHPHGFCGAVFHALCLAHTLRLNKLPSIEDLSRFVEYFQFIPDIINSDSQLSAFWLSAWETSFGSSLQAALDELSDEVQLDLEKISLISADTETYHYHEVLNQLGCLQTKFRGSGIKTAIAAAVLAQIFSNSSIEKALSCSANELNSDTDTIGTMCGALMGSISLTSPKWKIQDRSYLESEAARMASIAFKVPQPSFDYPDLGRWNPPASQAASVGRFDEGFAIAGLGQLNMFGPEYQMGDAIWQWASLPFGQTLIVKRKTNLTEYIPFDQLPSSHASQKKIEKIKNSTPVENLSQQPLFTNSSLHNSAAIQKNQRYVAPFLLDIATDAVIQSNFDDIIFGKAFNHCIDASQSIETAIAFAAIIAKAKLARQRRSN